MSRISSFVSDISIFRITKNSDILNRLQPRTKKEPLPYKERFFSNLSLFIFPLRNWSIPYFPASILRMLQHPRQENIRLSSIASRLRSEGISQNTRDSPSTQLYCCRKRYLPFPYPVTGSMIPCSAISRSKAVHLVGFRSSTLCTSDLPNTISFPKSSCNLRTCEAVFAVKSSSIFTFLFSMFTFSGSLKVSLMCNIWLWRGWFSFNRRFPSYRTAAAFAHVWKNATGCSRGTPLNSTPFHIRLTHDWSHENAANRSSITKKAPYRTEGKRYPVPYAYPLYISDICIKSDPRIFQ